MRFLKLIFLTFKEQAHQIYWSELKYNFHFGFMVFQFLILFFLIDNTLKTLTDDGHMSPVESAYVLA